MVEQWYSSQPFDVVAILQKLTCMQKFCKSWRPATTSLLSFARNSLISFSLRTFISSTFGLCCCFPTTFTLCTLQRFELSNILVFFYWCFWTTFFSLKNDVYTLFQHQTNNRVISRLTGFLSNIENYKGAASDRLAGMKSDITQSNW